MKCKSSLNNRPFGGGVVTNSDKTSSLAGHIPCELERFHEEPHQFTYMDTVTKWALTHDDMAMYWLNHLYEVAINSDLVCWENIKIKEFLDV